MKKALKLFAGLLCLSAAMTACKPDPAPVLPEFPDKVTRTVAADEIVNLVFKANLDWKIEMNQEEATYFSLDNNGNAVYSLQGKASDDIKVKVKVANLVDLDNNHVCTLTMTMDGQSQVIAELTLSKTERVINIYPVKVDEYGSFEYASSGDLTYAYDSHTVGADGVELVWPEGMNGFMTRVMVSANFDWTVDGAPEWIKAIEGGQSGISELWIQGNPAEYPAEASEATLKFVDATQTTLEVATLKVSIPSANDYLVAEFDEELKFNAAGDAYNAMLGDYVEGGTAGGYVTAAMGVQVVPFAFVSQFGGMTMPSTDISWVTVGVAEWDDEDASVIQSRRVDIAVSANDGAAREAMLFVLPADMSMDAYEMSEFADGMPTGEVAEAYLPYLVTTIKQEAAPATLEYEHAYGETVAFGISENGGSWPHNELGNADEHYDLLYTKDWDFDDVTIVSSKEISNIYISILGENGQFYDVENDTEFSWLTYWRPAADKTKFKVQMNTRHSTAEWALNANTGDYEGGFYIEFADGTTATIYARYNENASVGGDEGVNLTFAYPEYAESDGSTLVKLTSGPHYNYYSMNFGVSDVWHATFTKEYHSMSMINGLNTNGFLENEEDAEWLSYEYSEGGSSIITDAAGNGKTGAFLFSDGMGGIEFVLVVTLEIAEE